MTTFQWDAIWVNGPIVTGAATGHVIPEGAVAIKDGKTAWVGAVRELPDPLEDCAPEIYDLDGGCLTPGLIDCHTHLVYAGNRAHEFEMRLNGATYEDIARQGGGIQSTVTATREATEDELFAQSLPRAEALQQSGVTTIEIKSGYGLDWKTEVKILRVAKRIGEVLPLTVKRTFLGAHTVPKEYRDQAQAYTDLVCQEMIPQIAAEQLADSVDVFCENIAFSLAQTEQVFKAAKQHQLQIKCHSEQLSCSDSAVLAAKYQALSVDHLEHVSDAGIKAIADAGTAAVLLPGAFYFLREKKLPPLDKLRAMQVPIALASDCNPGTSPVTSLLLIMNMACTLFRMTPAEVMQGVTLNAAAALGMQQTHGSIAAGKAADFAVWNVKSPAELCYYLGSQPLKALIKSGKVIEFNQD